MMNIKTRLWLYDKTATDYKGTEYTQYIQLGDQNKDDLTEVLGGAELTLVGLNLRKEFDPSTRFIWEQYNIVDDEEIRIFHKDLSVESDYVSQPILSDDNYFNHHITFLEASVVAQKRIVDDIAVTYKLKDVNLFGSNSIDTKTYVEPTERENEKAFGGNFHFNGGFIGMFGASLYYGRKFKWEWATWLQNDSNYAQNANYQTYIDNIWDNKYQNVDIQNGNTITLSIPMLSVYVGQKDSSNYENNRQGFCAIDVKVVETDISTGLDNIVSSYTINPCSLNSVENEWNTAWYEQNVITNKGDSLNNYYYKTGLAEPYFYHKTLAKHKNTYDDRYITFTIQKNKKYSLRVSLHNYTDDVTIHTLEGAINPDNGSLPMTDISGNWLNLFGINVQSNFQRYCVTNDIPVAEMQFYVYDSSDVTYTLFTSAPPANAYDLFVKAVICSQDTYKKQSGVAITDQELPFYVDPEFVDELKNTQIYENSYHQNNLWQLFVEIGKYIHAIPLVKFGDDNRFKVTFTRLGITDETENNNPVKFGIFNHRTMEDYISSTSSYVNNLVQGGGIIQEVVAPKSTSNDYLVYNDVAKLVVSKNIIELVKLEVRDTNDNTHEWKDMTKYAYEKSIYEILPIVPNEPNNRGNAIYYSLGTNVIEGFDYTLPSPNQGTYNYAIKNILELIFNTGSPTNIKVNDYIFRVTYRTKDSARVDQTRPDLRKYLLYSDLDYAPLQYQFNNQQDRVLDAQRFGNNIYGKLIKTGNTEFEVNEWIENLDDLKRVGELYRLPEDNNNLYYVATVENTNYGSYITSNVTFSKDYNELSNMIGIPSEPRFYEIATENLIDREVSNNSYLVLGNGDVRNLPYVDITQRKSMVYDKAYIKDLLFTPDTEYPKYAVTCFKNDKDKQDSNVPENNMKYKGVLVPISTYSVQNTLNMEYDMVDNLSAGDKVSLTEDGSIPNTAYRTLSAVQYTDAHGRDDLFDMIILKDVDLTDDQIRELPESPYSVSHYNSYYELAPSFRQYTYECDRTQVNDWQTDFMTWANATIPQVVGVLLGDIFYVKTKMKYHDAIYGDYYVYGLVNLDIQIEQGVRTITIVQSFLQNGEPYPISEYDFNDLCKPLIPKNQAIFTTITNNADIDLNIGNLGRGKGLLKDNREIISINTNIHMITNSDRFVISGDLWTIKKKPVKLALLRKEVSKIINNKISSVDVIELADITSSLQWVGIDIDIIDAIWSVRGIGGDVSDIKALAIVVDDRIIEDDEVIYTPENYTFVMARNVDGLDENEKVENWYIAPKEDWNE